MSPTASPDAEAFDTSTQRLGPRPPPSQYDRCPSLTPGAKGAPSTRSSRPSRSTAAPKPSSARGGCGTPPVLSFSSVPPFMASTSTTPETAWLPASDPSGAPRTTFASLPALNTYGAPFGEGGGDSSPLPPT